MSNDPSRYGDQPLVPSTRVTETQLLDLQARASVLIVEGFTSPGDQAAAGAAIELLIEEIRRYRALLLGVARGHIPAECAWCMEAWRQRLNALVQNDSLYVRSAREMQAGRAAEGCPYAALEAEAEAIRAERKP